MASASYGRRIVRKIRPGVDDDWGRMVFGGKQGPKGLELAQNESAKMTETTEKNV